METPACSAINKSEAPMLPRDPTHAVAAGNSGPVIPIQMELALQGLREEQPQNRIRVLYNMALGPAAIRHNNMQSPFLPVYKGTGQVSTCSWKLRSCIPCSEHTPREGSQNESLSWNNPRYEQKPSCGNRVDSETVDVEVLDPVMCSTQQVGLCRGDT